MGLNETMVPNVHQRTNLDDTLWGNWNDEL